MSLFLAVSAMAAIKKLKKRLKRNFGKTLDILYVISQSARDFFSYCLGYTSFVRFYWQQFSKVLYMIALKGYTSFLSF